MPAPPHCRCFAHVTLGVVTVRLQVGLVLTPYDLRDESGGGHGDEVFVPINIARLVDDLLAGD